MLSDILTFLGLSVIGALVLLLVGCAPPPQQYSPMPTIGPGYLPAYPDRQKLEEEWNKDAYQYDNHPAIQGK